MGTLTHLESERNLRVSKAIFAAAETAATSPQIKTSLLAEIAELLEPGPFSFSFLNGFTFFGYPSQARDVLLTVLERCMGKGRGRGVARFDVEGIVGEIVLNYKTRTLEITADGEPERWQRRPLPKHIEAALKGGGPSPKPASPPVLRLRKSATYEFTKGKESVVLSYYDAALHRLRRAPQEKLYRSFTERLVGLSAKTRMKERVAVLLKKDFVYAGERRIPERSIMPRGGSRTIRGEGAPPPMSREVNALVRELVRKGRQLVALPRQLENGERARAHLERAIRKLDKLPKTAARKKERTSTQAKLRRARKLQDELLARDPKELARDIRKLERQLKSLGWVSPSKSS